jgi:hypothetical protein
LIHRHGISCCAPPGPEIPLPFYRARKIGGNDSDIIFYLIHCKNDVNDIFAVGRTNKITGEVFVLMILLDDFITGMG